MRWLLLFAFALRLVANPFDEVIPSAPEEIASLNADLLVDGFVSAISGQLALSEVDLRVKSAQDLTLRRTYVPPRILGRYHAKEERDRLELGSALLQLNAKGWVVLPHLWAGYNRNSPHFQLRDPQGSVLEFEIQGKRGVLKSSHGCSNLASGEPSSAADIRNIELLVEGDQVKVTWPDGVGRIYLPQGAGLYRLDREMLPNGKAIRYHWNHAGLFRITSTDASGKHTYAFIDRVGNHCYRGSDGREAHLSYETCEVRGKNKKEGLKANFHFPVLTRAANPSYSNNVGYNERTLLTSYDAKSYPISCTYWQQQGSLCRIQKFSTPSGTTTFIYDPPIARQKGGATTVTHPNGSQTIYRFNTHFLLSAIENWFEGRLYNQKLFSYDYKQHIAKIEIQDGRGNALLAKIYECDPAGNPVSETWEGDFGLFSIQRAFSKNRVVKEERSDGLGFEYTYLDDTHLLTSKTTISEGILIRRTEYTYDDAHNLIEEREVGKTATTYLLYREGPHLHRPEWKIEKDWEGSLIHKTHLIYDRFGHLAEEAHYGSDDLFAYRTVKTYDSRDDLLEESNPLGQTASYAYDARGRQTREIPFSQNKIIHRTFDDKGRVTILQEGDHITRFAYNCSDELIQKTDYLGLKTDYCYHPVHHKPVRIEEDLTLLEISYDDFGREMARKDVYGATTATQPNSYGDPLVIIHPDGGRETFRYAPNRALLSAIDPDGLITAYTYDPLKRILSKTIGSRRTTYIYDAYHLLEEKDPLGASTHYHYNLAGQKIQETRGDRTCRFSYDPLGFFSKTENASRCTTYQNDVLGRVVAQSIDGRLDTSYTYDPAGNIASITRQSTTRFAYDPYNRLVEKVEADGAKTTLSYKEGDCLLTKTTQNPKGISLIEIYNAQGLLLKREIPGCILEEYSYDRALRLASQDHLTFTYTPEGFRSSLTEAGERTTRWTYTPGGKIQTKIKPDGTKLLYEYTEEGDLARVGSREFRYDALGRVIGGTGFSREYDLFDNVIREELATGLIVKTSYDNSDRPIQWILPDQSRILYEYEGPFPTKISRLDTSGDLLYVHTYDQIDISGHLLSETGLFHSAYQYDQTGRRIAQTSPHFTEELSYDKTGNLIQKGLHSYTYDAADQLISSPGQFSLTYDRHYNRLAHNIAYDANGNPIQSGFSFDEFDQLVRAGDEAIAYDALGRRLQKGAISYLYFGDEEVGAFEQGKAKELKIPGYLAPVAIEIESKPYAPVTDVQGTIRLLVDWKTNKILHQNHCTPFGTDLSADIPYAYVGKRYDPMTDLIYFGKRYYVPSLGRWLTPDPLGPVDHSNLYQYLFNNPYRFHDPYGESIGECLLGLGEMVLGGALIFTGGAIELGSFGTLTMGFVFAETTGIALIGHGLNLAIKNTQDFSSRPNDNSSTPITGGLIDSFIVQKNDSGCPPSREIQDKQFKDAVKEIEKQLGKKLKPDEVRELHDHVSGQGYGYHELVEEGYWLLGGS